MIDLTNKFDMIAYTQEKGRARAACGSNPSQLQILDEDESLPLFQAIEGKENYDPLQRFSTSTEKH